MAEALSPITIRQRLIDGDKLSKNYKVKDVVGMGSQATVSLALHKKTNEKVAVKVYNVSQPRRLQLIVPAET